MDKNTLSNYGWIVIAVLVLSVMIALATPFGSYVKNATESTLTGLFDTSESALNVVGMSATGTVEVMDQEENPVVAGATFAHYDEGHNIVDEFTTLTWEELKLPENGTSFYYDASAISDTVVGNSAFTDSYLLKNIILPDSITTIEDYAFANSFLTNITIPEGLTSIGEFAFVFAQFTNIEFKGTVEQWNAIEKHENWVFQCPEFVVTCTNGTVTVPSSM